MTSPNSALGPKEGAEGGWREPLEILANDLDARPEPIAQEAAHHIRVVLRSAPSPVPAHAGLVSEAHQMSLTLRGLETHDAERTWALSSKVQFLLTRLANALESIK